MNKKYFWRGFITGSIAFILLTVLLYNKYVVQPDQPDISLSQIEIQDLDGKKVELTNYIGKPLVVNYWATWCAPCIEEFPHFAELKKQMENDVNFIMISDESVEKIEKFKNSKEYSFNYFRSNFKLSGYGIYAIPTTYFYDANGSLVNKYTSNLTLEKLKELISEIQ